MSNLDELGTEETGSKSKENSNKKGDPMKAKITLYMSLLLDNARTVNEMLAEGHHEAAAMLQSKFCYQFEEAIAGMKQTFCEPEESPTNKERGQGIRAKKQ